MASSCEAPVTLIVAGLSHRTAPLEVRERLVYRAQEAGDSLSELSSRGVIHEGVIVSTCNRTELYALAPDGDSLSGIWEMLSRRLGANASEHGYVMRDRETAAHLFRVTAGLDSMILGEAQIHGQVKSAWEQSRAHSGAVLNRLFQTALLAASRARSETGIGRGAASVSSASVQLAKKIFGSLNGHRVMILGAGDVAELALECLISEGVHLAIVANRTYDRATELAARFGAAAIRYDECWDSLRDVDVLLCSTAAPVPIVSTSRVTAATAGRGGKPLCILDMAMPRDVEAGVGSLPNVFLYDIDDLRDAAAANLGKREEDIPKALSIIEAEASRFWDWVAGLEAVPVMLRFREEMDRMREAELGAALKRLGPLTPEQAEGVEHLTKSIMNKFLHEPSVRLKAAAANGRGLGVVDAARYLFGLDQETNSKPGE